MEKELKTIFLVDDNATNLAVGRDALEEYYDVYIFNSGARVLKVLEKNTPDLILLDIEMPEMNGYEVMKQIRSNPDTSSIPVIFLTAKSDGESELEGLSLGAVDYIFKPFSPPLLRKRIENHLLIEAQKHALMEQKQVLINFNENLQEMVDAKTETVVELQNAVLKTMAELVEFRDDITGGHIDRTQRYLSILLDALSSYGLHRLETADWDMGLVLQSAQLHDVGKIAIRDGILQKPERLTDDEFEEIKSHTVFGEKVIRKIMKNTTKQEFLEYARIFAISHHEKWDGSGYPNQLSGDDIPLLGRVMAIADVYDALVSDRPYKEAYSHEKAVDIISENKGTHFDPDIVDLFLSISDRFAQIMKAE